MWLYLVFRHDIAELLMKVALNTIDITYHICCYGNIDSYLRFIYPKFT
jgi:hypothetical protein